MRIVQDSEDEDDLDLDDVAPAAPNGRDAPSQYVDPSPQAPDAGTGSTDSLKRTIEAAHRAHLQSPSGASSDHSRHQSSGSLAGHDSKRRRTSSDAIAVNAPAMSSSRKKGPVTYGKSKTLFDSPTLEQRLDGSESRQTVATEKVWDLQGTVGDAWQHHEPLGLFSEPSSTVPNATATQRQLLDQVLAPELLGVEAESDAPRYEPAKSSVPWSEYLKSSARNTQDEPDPTDPVGPPLDQHQSSQPHSGSGGSTLEPTPPFAHQTQSSQRNRTSSNPLKESPLRKEVSQDPVIPRESMGPPAITNHAVQAEVDSASSPAASRVATHSLHSQSIDNGLGLSLVQTCKPQEEIVVASPTVKAKQESGSIPNSEDDLIAIGLLKEKYKPRPSRSRSLKLTAEEPVDYSVRPEKAARRTRRSRTTGGETSSSVSTPEKLRQICDMGFTPSTTQRALRHNNGDVSSTVDWLVANNMADDELAPSRLPKTTGKTTAKSEKDASHKIDASNGNASASEERDQEGMVSKSSEADAASSTSAEKVLTEPAEDRPVVIAKSPRVSVIIPRSKGPNVSRKADLTDTIAVATPKRELAENTSKKSKRRKTTVDPPELLEEATDTVSNETPKEKRRGRGRPRKEPKSTEGVPEEQQKDLVADAAADTSTVLQELKQQPNAPAADTAADADGARATTPLPSSSHSAPPPITPPSATAELASKPPLQTLEKSSTSATGGNNLPLNKGKTPYRVGLSKRARIAPLLRIVKK